MRTAVVSALLLAAAASVAHAQAPGDYAPPPPPPMYQPAYQPLAAPPLPEPDPINAHRFSLGLTLGSTVLGSRYGESLVFGGGTVTAGIRVSRHWELTGEFGGGGGSDNGSGASNTSLALGLTGLRYHVNPSSPTCFFLEGGLGIGSLSWDDQLNGSGPRFATYLGAGVEHRWPRMSLSLTLRTLELTQSTNEYYEGGIERTGDSPQPSGEWDDPAAARGGVQLLAGLNLFL